MDCEICDSGTAVSRCLQCDQQMCAECKGMHLKFKATRDHSFADFDEDKQQKIHQVIPTSIFYKHQVIKEFESKQGELEEKLGEVDTAQQDLLENIVATRRRIYDFKRKVTSICDELCVQANERHKAMQADVQLKQDSINAALNALTSAAQKLNELSTSKQLLGQTDDTSLALQLESYQQEIDEMTRSALNSDDDSSTHELCFVAPSEAQLRKLLILRVHAEGTSDDGYETASCYGVSGDSQTVPDVQRVQPAYETMVFRCPATRKDLMQPPAVHNVRHLRDGKPIVPGKPPPLPPPRRRRSSNSQQPAGFESLIEAIMENEPDKVIEQFQSGLAMAIINEQLWVLTPRFINIFSLSVEYLRKLEMKAIKSGKLGLNPTACAQNQHAIYITFCRSRVNTKQASINGVWTVDADTGHMVHKLENGEYVSVSCTSTSAVALHENLTRITLCTKTGTRATDYSMTSFDLSSPCTSRSLLTHHDRILLISHGNIVTMDHSNRCVSRQQLPTVTSQTHYKDGYQWHLCGIDNQQQVLLCEQVTGCVMLRDVDDEYHAVHFGEKNSFLEDPVSIVQDHEGSLWVQQQTIYGELIVKFTKKME